jgi:hypothetical protein
MANGPLQSKNLTHVIDLKDIYKILMEAKILIVSVILIFTIASIIYSLSLKPSFITSTKLEIGYVIEGNGDKVLIESASDLISDLKVVLLKNPDDLFNQEISMNSFENKLIEMETFSNSSKKNAELLTYVKNYIFERHNNISLSLISQSKKSLTKEIDKSQAQINFIKSKISDQNQFFEKINKGLSNENIANISLNFFIENSQYKDQLFEINLRILALREKLENIDNQKKSKTQTIQKLKTYTIQPNFKMPIFLGICVGSFIAIFLALIKNFITAYLKKKV